MSYVIKRSQIDEHGIYFLTLEGGSGGSIPSVNSTASVGAGGIKLSVVNANGAHWVCSFTQQTLNGFWESQRITCSDEIFKENTFRTAFYPGAFLNIAPGPAGTNVLLVTVEMSFGVATLKPTLALDPVVDEHERIRLFRLVESPVLSDTPELVAELKALMRAELIKVTGEFVDPLCTKERNKIRANLRKIASERDRLRIKRPGAGSLVYE